VCFYPTSLVKQEIELGVLDLFMIYIPGVPELPHDILIAYSGVKIKTKIERKNVEGPIVSIL
jgi:hypothetical protein